MAETLIAIAHLCAIHTSTPFFSPEWVNNKQSECQSKMAKCTNLNDTWMGDNKEKWIKCLEEKNK